MIRLVSKEEVGRVGDLVEGVALEAAEVAAAMSREFYDRVGAVAPWRGYFAVEETRAIGSCGFKGNPVNGAVEIAYFTFPPYEGRGFGTQMASALVRLALETDASLQVIAHTLPEPNASTRILSKNGFRFAGEVMDPEDGRVWRWEYEG
ncbi:MAG TPA: GNAT family N-acetyltransferase [Thermoanaerobaculia bacterium]|nr:GNAT family N-acetyltransferase [Thermoanaerobaculia bacterium]